MNRPVRTGPCQIIHRRTYGTKAKLQRPGKMLTLGRQRQGFSAPVQQGDTHVSFQRAQLLADCGVANIQCLSGHYDIFALGKC